MAACLFALNNDLFSPLDCDGTRYAAFSGNGQHRNNPDSEAVPSNGPIPLGTHFIVDRGSGGTLGHLWSWATNRDRWFALYKDDGSVDDETFVNGVRRGEFRLHPIGPARTSLGCITLQYPREFTQLRDYLLSQPVAYTPGTGTRTYGTVEVYLPVILPPGVAYA